MSAWGSSGGYVGYGHGPSSGYGYSTGGGGGGGGGGFVVGGRVERYPAASTSAGAAGSSSTTEVITLSSDDDDNGGEGYDAWSHRYEYHEEEEEEEKNEEDVELVRVLPKSKSRLLPAGRPPISDEPGVSCTYDSGPSFAGASVTDYEHEQDSWSLDPAVKSGYVKEYVTQGDDGGIGLIFANDAGLVLFGESHVYAGPDGGRPKVGSSLVAGTPVSFVCYQVKSAKYKAVSDDGFFRVAAAVWEPSFGAHVGQRLLRAVTAEGHRAELKSESESFLKLVRSNRFLPMAFVRCTGQVEGYLNHKVGILKTEDGSRVLFHASDVYMFRKPLSQVQQQQPIDFLLPAGLNVKFDARLVETSLVIRFQACAVFVGTWPKVPHPTLLPGGPGTRAPCYVPEDLEGRTFYYFQLGLGNNLDTKWQAFVDNFGRQAGTGFNFVKSSVAIRNGKDYNAWKAKYSPYPVQQQGASRGGGGRRGGGIKRSRNAHFFRGPPEKPKVKEEKEKVKLELGNPNVKRERLDR